MSIIINKRQRLLNFVAISTCASFSWIVLGPIGVYTNNADDFTIDLISLLQQLSIIASSVFLILLIIGIFLPEKKSNALARIIALVSLSSWVFANFLYGDYGRLDGKSLIIIPWNWLGLSQLGMLVVLIVTIVKIKISNVYKAVYFVFLAGMVSSIIGIAKLDKQSFREDQSGFHSGMTGMSPNKNVLHVVLDALQSDLFSAAIESDDSLKDKFKGFTFYNNASSIYPTTQMSIPMMVTGEIYRNQQTKKEFLRELESKNIGVKKLVEHGFQLDFHSVCKDYMKPCTSISPKVVGKTAQISEVAHLLDIYTFKSVPDWLKPYIYNNGDWLFLSNSNIDSYLKIKPPGLAHLIFTDFVKELHVAHNPTPRYKLYHSIITHDPVRLDANCKIVPQEQLASLVRVEFVKCGIRHFTLLLDKLKALGIFDKTMIILSSDHGAGYSENFNQGFHERGISQRLVGLASATLLIKPFNTLGEMRVSEAQVSLRDIPHTILSANNIDPASKKIQTFPARDILKVDPADDRKREYLHYAWEHKYWNEPKLPPITLYQISGDIRNPLSWPGSLSVE